MMRKVVAYLPHVAAIWGLGILVALIAGEPLLGVTPHALDEEVYRSGGLLLEEGFRVLVAKWGRAALISASILGSGHLILLLFRGRLTREVVHIATNQAFDGPWQKGLLRYVGVYFLGRVTVGLIIAGIIYGVMRLPSKEGTLAPGPVSLQLAWLAFGALLALAALILFELWATALFFRTDRKPARCAVACLRKALAPLLLVRIGRSLLSAATALVIARLVLSPPLEGLLGAALALSFSQLLVLSGLVVDVLWLEFVAGHLQRSQT